MICDYITLSRIFNPMEEVTVMKIVLHMQISLTAYNNYSLTLITPAVVPKGGTLF